MKAKRHTVLMMSDLQSGAQQMSYITDADASTLESEIDQLRSALKVAQQAILEFSHAQECGPGWYTRGANGMYQQVNQWLRRGLEAVQSALGPYDDNGEYLKELPASEPSGGLPIRFPADEQKLYIYPWAGFETVVFQPDWRTARIWKEGDNLCFIAGPAEKPSGADRG